MQDLLCLQQQQWLDEQRGCSASCIFEIQNGEYFTITVTSFILETLLHKESVTKEQSQLFLASFVKIWWHHLLDELHLSVKTRKGCWYLSRLLLGHCAAPLGVCDSQGGKRWPTELPATTLNPILGFSAAVSPVGTVVWGDLPVLGWASLGLLYCLRLLQP